MQNMHFAVENFHSVRDPSMKKLIFGTQFSVFDVMVFAVMLPLIMVTADSVAAWAAIFIVAMLCLVLSEIMKNSVPTDNHMLDRR